MTTWPTLSLAWPWALLLWPLLALHAPPGRRVALRHPDAAAVAPALRSRPARRRWGSLAQWLAWTLLVLAAARPQVDRPDAVTAETGRHWMLALDLSASMGTADLVRHGQPVTRLEAARQLLAEFLAAHPGDRAGLVVFARQAYLHTPLTPDLAAVRAALKTLPDDLAGQETALGDGLALALKHLPAGADDRPPPAILLISDGAGNAGRLDPARAGWLAARAGVRVHTLHLSGSGTAGADTLAALAQQTGGIAWQANSTQSLDALRRALDEATPRVRGERRGPRRDDLYAWPAGAALVLLLIVILAAGRRRATWR